MIDNPDRRTLLAGLGAFATGLGGTAVAQSEAEAAQKGIAELILFNGKITTLDPRKPEAQAVAIRGERIVAAGRTWEIMRLAGNEPHRDPQEQHAADQPQVGDRGDLGNQQGKDDSQQHRRGGTEEQPPAPLVLRQRPARQRDHHGVVGAQGKGRHEELVAMLGGRGFQPDAETAVCRHTAANTENTVAALFHRQFGFAD